MNGIRSFLALPSLLVVLTLALLMRAWVPAGYMPVVADGAVRLMPCSGHGVLAPPAAAEHGHGVSDHMMSDHMAAHDAGDDHQGSATQADMPCAFSMSMPGVAGADPQLLVAALAFLFVAALVVRRRPLSRRVAFLIPPAQAPPF